MEHSPTSATGTAWERTPWRATHGRAWEAEESRGVTLLADLDAFYLEHERCGDLDSAVGGDRVWMTCTCGAVINRCADDD
jgi:hypothetical protein